MGKLAYLYTDSEETEDTSSSVENVKKKKKLSILKYTSGNLKKKKCKLHTKSEPEESDRSRKSNQRIFKQKLRGILKHTEREYSEETEDTSSSVENVKKKKKLSILKYTSGNLKKKKCKLHTKSEPEESDRSRKSNQRIFKQKLRGILKHTERESSEEEEESEPSRSFRSQDRCLVGQVPRGAGAKPGRGGGVAIIVKKNVSNLPSQQSSTSGGKRQHSAHRRISRKRSY